MPTGYTAPVGDGTVTEFQQFALQCARAFGALITMRDDPMDAPIPDEFTPSTHHTEQLAKATTRLAELQAMTPEQIAAAAHEAETTRIQQEREWAAERAQKKARYEAMLAHANAYVPPSEDHENFRQFMIDQLTESIRFDCPDCEIAPECSPEEWHAAALKSAEWSIQYHTEEGEQEVVRAAGRTQWIQQLKASLEATQCSE